ncbi:hypothetical protein D3C84_1063900 [compost metagenome]
MALLADSIEPLLQLLQQALGLLAFVAELLAVLVQLVAFVVERALDALVDGPFALAQALVLVALHLVVTQCGLQFSAQLADLGD